MRIYGLLDRLLEIILVVYNIFSNIQFVFRIKLRCILKNNKNLKNMCGSEECFILGNGPSIKNVDFNKLKDKDTFTVNYFYKYKKRDFHSKFFVAVDELFCDGESAEYIQSIYEEYPDMKMILKCNSYFNSPTYWNLDRSFFTYAKQFQTGKRVQVDCTKNMTAGINVVLQCIQIALFMGYKRIYLLGCEFSEYASLKLDHFYGDEQKNGQYLMGEEARWAAVAHYHHYALYEYAHKHGIEIINLTPGSLIDAYPRKTLDEVIG